MQNASTGGSELVPETQSSKIMCREDRGAADVIISHLSQARDSRDVPYDRLQRDGRRRSAGNLSLAITVFEKVFLLIVSSSLAS